jgi:hypothetical protein
MNDDVLYVFVKSLKREFDILQIFQDWNQLSINVVVANARALHCISLTSSLLATW